MDGRLRIILLAAVLAVSGCRDEQAALTVPPDPESTGAAGADRAGAAVAAADSTTEAEECDPILVEVEIGGETMTVYLCRRDSNAAGAGGGAAGVASDRTLICWYWVVEYRIGGILVGRTEELQFCEVDSDPAGGADPEVTLSCPGTPERGAMAACTVTVADHDDVDPSELVFEWESGFGASWTDTTGTGESDWSGVATGDTEVTVTVTGGGIAETTESATVTVTARTWPLYKTFSWGTPNYSHDPDPDLWGEHRVTLDLTPSEQEGSGPWDGTVIIASRPDMSTSLWLHSDFLESGVSYGKVDQISTQVHPCVRDLGSSANVHEMNEACGLSGALSSFRAKVEAHERKHESSLNQCLESQTALDWQRDLEALVGEGLRGRRTLQDQWQAFVRLVWDANEGQVPGDQSSDIWHRLGRTPSGIWVLDVVSTGGHAGTRGC